MGLFDRVEGKLSSAVMGTFARAFKSEVQPVEIASAIRTAMDDKAAVVGRGRAFVPNVFTIELSATDYDRLAGYAEDLEDELIAAAEEHAESQGYRPGGPVDIILRQADNIETGVFRVRTSTAKRPRATGATGQHERPARDERPQRRYADPYRDPQRRPREPRPEPAAPPPPMPHADRYADPYDPDDDADPLESATVREAPEEPAAPPPRRRVTPADRPWLDIGGDRYPLMSARSILGRDDTADVILDDPGISRRHSEVRVTQDGPNQVCTLRDLGSTNGTFVNGERITTTRLRDGDRITIGRTSVTFHSGRR